MASTRNAKTSKTQQSAKQQSEINGSPQTVDFLELSSSSSSSDSSESDSPATTSQPAKTQSGEDALNLEQCLEQAERERRSLAEDNVKLKKEVRKLELQVEKEHKRTLRVKDVAQQELDKCAAAMEQQGKEIVDNVNAELDKMWAWSAVKKPGKPK